jgi:prepilin-type N-terminal cleavage/methylation domain-containing protein
MLGAIVARGIKLMSTINLRLSPRRSACRGFTLVELLVVITIIGILVSLLLPAVQSARESAHAAQCQNNLRQFGVAALNHERAKGYFPSGGWGSAWVGDPDQGFGYKQPGNWAFSLLPYMEQTTIWSLGQKQSTSAKPAYLAQQVTVVIPSFYCPSGRQPDVYPYTATTQPANTTSLSGVNVLKIDYAINAGDYPYPTVPFLGPSSISAGLVPTYWTLSIPSTAKLSGVSFLHSQIKIAHITDGTSNTYLIGEKYVDPNQSTAGTDPGDTETAMTGFDENTFRYGASAGSDATATPPRPETRNQTFVAGWGSIHPTMCHFVFCDGSVHDISFSIDPVTHRRLSNRSDGLQVDQSTLTD